MKNFQRVFVFSFIFILGFLCQSKANACEGESCHDFLIRFSDRASAQQVSDLLSSSQLEAVQFFPGTKIFHVEGSSTESAEKILKKLNSNHEVAYAEPNYRVEATTSPNDPYYSLLWGLHNANYPGVDMGMEASWNILTGGTDVIVAVIDTGVDYNHEDLAANMWTNSAEIPDNDTDDDGNGFVDDVHGYNFWSYNGDPMDDHYHGTHVAGTIGAVGNNGIGVAGVNWNVKLMAVKFLSSSGSGYLSDAISAIEYAVNNGAKVLNNSWAFSSGQAIPANPALEPVQSLRDVIQVADDAGVVFVAAAGNSGEDSDQYANYPSAYSVRNIISVAATDEEDSLAYFSNWGPISVDLGAPGLYIYSSLPMDYSSPPYGYLSGTSMASPHVAGAAAILWQNNPSLTHRQVIDRILQGVTPNTDLTHYSVTGGSLNVWNSLLLNDPSLNHAPIANAGADQYKEVGDVIALNGSATDEDGQTSFTYSWTLTKPSGSAASLNSSSSASPQFTADVAGTYYASLTASDGTSASISSTSNIVVAEGASSRPTVVIKAQSGSGSGGGEATIGSEVSIGEKIVLNGTQSSSASTNTEISASASDALSYAWSFIERPSGSSSSIQDNDQAIANFTPDSSGRYTVSLSVSNGKYTSTGEMSFQASSTETTSGGSSGGGSGGCSLQSENTRFNPALFLCFGMGFLVLIIPRKIH